MAFDAASFAADPTVTLAADGSTALLEDDIARVAVLLTNDPGAGGAEVIVPEPGQSLVFEYEFVEGFGEDDEFGAFIVDPGTGGSAGAGFEFYTQRSGSGEVQFDLSALAGRAVGLQFQLASLPGDRGSQSRVTVANLRLE